MYTGGSAGVYSSVRPSVRPSVCLSSNDRRRAAPCGGFAAERRASGRYRPPAAAAERSAADAPQHGNPAANAGSATLSAGVGS